ncbi:MAG: SRPBCC family protein [Gammaproteobacteria bacterium]|nr:SRPBCC family protein [Gammaproteobacteria bacterium]
MVLHKELTINAPAQQVFAYWADFRNFQQFISMIETIEVLDDKRSRWVIHAPLGHKVVFESLITTFEPNKNLVWESSHADAFARGDLRLVEQGESTRVELDFEYNLYPHWMQNIARLVNRFGFPSLAFDHGLARIKEKIEKDNINHRQF